MDRFVLAIDQGTTSSRAMVFDGQGAIRGLGQHPTRQIFPHPGWVNQDADDLWETTLRSIHDALAAASMSAGKLTAIGITNQRETTIIWDRTTGDPIHNAIVWQDRRTSDICDQIRSRSGEMITAKTGLEVDAYFSASKIKWLLDNVNGSRERAEAGDLAFGTVDTWLVWKLTNGKVHVTDHSNASRTMLFNINTLTWDDELLEIFDVPRSMLPDVRSSSHIVAEIEDPPELRGIPIAGIAGDQQAALFGQACFEKGSSKNTYGTGCFMLQNVGDRPVLSKNRLLSTIACNIDGQTDYALEGSVFIGGAVIQWLRDALGIIETSSDVETLAASVDDNGGVYFVPALVGLGAPYWDQSARGTIIGLTRGTGRAHIARAAIESIALQTADLLTAMNSDSQRHVAELRVDGGATCNDALLQFQADILQIPVVRSKTPETTALGAAYLAGLATGYWTSKEELAEHWGADRRFEPKLSKSDAAAAMDRWHEAVGRSLNWAK